jgi:hypothetical protein
MPLWIPSPSIRLIRVVRHSSHLQPNIPHLLPRLRTQPFALRSDPLLHHPRRRNQLLIWPLRPTRSPHPSKSAPNIRRRRLPWLPRRHRPLHPHHRPPETPPRLPRLRSLQRRCHPPWNAHQPQRYCLRHLRIRRKSTLARRIPDRRLNLRPANPPRPIPPRRRSRHALRLQILWRTQWYSLWCPSHPIERMVQTTPLRPRLPRLSDGKHGVLARRPQSPNPRSARLSLKRLNYETSLLAACSTARTLPSGRIRRRSYTGCVGRSLPRESAATGRVVEEADA